MRTFFLAGAAALALSACAASPRVATLPPPDGDMPRIEAPAQPAPLSQLVSAVDIPYERFVLPNGLTTLVHTDRKAPVVGVMLYYRVGSKHEPRGRTGFAHLYEHLFFGGSENVEDFDAPLEASGSTPTNGSTWYDRTNYFETVPTGALELALFQESDRMGHLLGKVSQGTLDRERGVVQNEKRQGDNQPYALADEYAVAEGLFPVGHPYRHSTIGSMADLDAATLGDVRKWFVDHYGPNNVVLALTGDIDAATARPLVEKWFGAIPRGPEVAPVQAGPVTLAAPASRDVADQVPVLRITRNWSGPGLNDADAPALEIGMRILGGLASSRLDNALVRGEQIAVAVTAGAQTFEQVSMLQATMDVKPGVDRAVAEARLDALIASYLAEGPSEDEVRRAVTSTVSAQIGALERVGGGSGKGATLAEGQLYSGDPAKFRKDLAAMAALTPAEVKAALNRWLGRPVLAVNVVPGERTESGDKMGGWGDEAASPAPKADLRRPIAAVPPGPPRVAPPVAPVADLVFPRVEHARLSNGIAVALAQRGAVPKAIVSLQFDAGIAADALDGPGTQSFLLDMLDEGTTSRNATQIAEEQERLGASLEAGAGMDSSTVTLSALTANLAPSLALMADVVRNPALAAGEVERVRARRQSDLAQVMASPDALAARTFNAQLFGAGHAYGQAPDGLGTPESLAAATPDHLRAAQQAWLRPDNARILVVGDVSMAQLLPMLEKAFGDWQAPAVAIRAKPAGAVPPERGRIVLLDRPNSPQSFILAGRVLPLTGRDQGQEPLDMAADVLGGSSLLTRLNGELRVAKHWSYGSYARLGAAAGPRSLSITAPVQADRTGDAIRAIIDLMAAFPGKRPLSADELQRVSEGFIRSLPNRYETNAQVLRALTLNALLGRPDDYQATLASRIRAVNGAMVEQAARQHLSPQGLTFVVVGDRRSVEPQLRKLGLPIEVTPAPAAGD